MFSDEDDRPYHIGSRIAGVVQGYKPQVDWGGDAGSATIVLGRHNVKVATPGWRRRCLYLLLVALLVLSLVNLSLTLLVLKTTHFNVDGMGELHVTVGGLNMEGTTRFLGKVAAAQVSSIKERNLPIEGYYNLSLLTLSRNPTDAFLHLGVDHVTSGTRVFQVRATSGQPLFESRLNGTTVGAERLTVTGSQGAAFRGSVQTPLLFSRGLHELRLESITRGLAARGSQEVSLEARDGDISVVSSSDLTLGSRFGAIRFDNPKIFLTGLLEEEEEGGGGVVVPAAAAATTISPQDTQIPPPDREISSTTPVPPSSSSSSAAVEVYQVCVCPNGRLFLMEAAVLCEFVDAVCR